jgi:hypothetical protein
MQYRQKQPHLDGRVNRDAACFTRKFDRAGRSGRIFFPPRFNVDLVRAPLPCIDHVIVHELAHGRHPNHGRAFFDLLSQMMPDWDRWKLALELMLA